MTDPGQPPGDPKLCDKPADCPEEKKKLDFTIGGQNRMEPNASNFFFQPLVLTDEPPSEKFVNQRMRLWLTVNPGEMLEGYVQMQIGGISWGKNVDFPKTFIGPNFPPANDHVGIMLRRGWVAIDPASLEDQVRRAVATACQICDARVEFPQDAEFPSRPSHADTSLRGGELIRPGWEP